MPIEKVVLVEDEPGLRHALEAHLRQRRCDVLAVETLAAAKEALAKDTFDLIFLDVRLPDGEGTDLLKELQPRPQRPLVVVMTAFPVVESAVDCMRNGAFDYLVKPFQLNQIDIVLKKADEFSRILRVNQFLSKETDPGWELLGRSPAIEQLRLLIRQVARTQATVLIQGESGTGKELVAHALHKESPRAAAPLIKVNCAAIPDNLIESEFFGHEKGAFTGALNKREGRFELAHGGTILLDEISEISPSLQSKLLRVLQEREFERVGGTRTIKVDVRVIATTNRRLEQSVLRKEFREDLFFRINVVPMLVAPLRERREDILFLAEHFLHWFARKHGCAAQRLSDACLGALTAHSWPGNVRELQNVIERAVILAGDSPLVEPPHLCLNLLPGQPLPAPPPAPETQAPAPLSARPPTQAPPPQTADAFPPLHELEKRHIFAALERCRNNRTQAAKALGISVRTLRNKLNEYSGHAPNASQDPEDSEDSAEAPRGLNAA
ncbi:MAG: sigma-54 dependent transcriptional regulator [Verrucomicrobiota bacterium]